MSNGGNGSEIRGRSQRLDELGTRSRARRPPPGRCWFRGRRSSGIRNEREAARSADVRMITGKGRAPGSAGAIVARALGVDVDRSAAAGDDFFVDPDLLDAVERGQLEHGLQ